MIKVNKSDLEFIDAVAVEIIKRKDFEHYEIREEVKKAFLYAGIALEERNKAFELIPEPFNLEDYYDLVKEAKNTPIFKRAVPAGDQNIEKAKSWEVVAERFKEAKDGNEKQLVFDWAFRGLARKQETAENFKSRFDIELCSRGVLIDCMIMLK